MNENIEREDVYEYKYFLNYVKFVSLLEIYRVCIQGLGTILKYLMKDKNSISISTIN